MDRASSRPPPRAREPMAEMVGMGRAEMWVNVERRRARKAAVLQFWNSCQLTSRPHTSICLGGASPSLVGLCPQVVSDGQASSWGRHVLLGREAPPLLEVRARTEGAVDRAGKDQGPRGALAVLARRTAEAPVPALRGELLPRGRVILRVDVVYLAAQGRQQRPRYGVPRRGAVQLEDPDVARVGRGHVGDADQGRLVCGGVAPAGGEGLERPPREDESRAGRHGRRILSSGDANGLRAAGWEGKKEGIGTPKVRSTKRSSTTMLVDSR